MDSRNSENIMDMDDDSLICLNVSGRRYSIKKLKAREMRCSLFEKLADGQTPSGVSYQKMRKEFFVERSPAMFEIILQYAYTGHLNRPPYICVQSLKDELKFWHLDTTNVLPCCNTINPAFKKNMSVLARSREGKKKKKAEQRLGVSKIRQCLDKLWEFCEDPESSKTALAFNIICILSIVLSIANLVVGTVPNFQHCDESQLITPPSLITVDDFSNLPPNLSNFTTSSESKNWSITNLLQKFKVKRYEKYSNACDGGVIFDLIEIACIVWFTVELSLRFVSCPNKWAFIKSPLNIIDFLATFPFYIEIAIWASGLITDLNRISGVSSVLLMLRVMRVMRAFRVLRLARYFDSLQLMGETLWESRRDMGLLVLFLAVGVLIFSTILFYIEREVEGTDFSSIPAAFWWAIVTLTTTGYGDVTPQTPMGKIMAAVACIAGVLIVAFPVSILVEHFRLSYASRRRNAIACETMFGQFGQHVVNYNGGSKMEMMSCTIAEESFLINDPFYEQH